MLQYTKLLTKQFERQYHTSRPLFADNNTSENNNAPENNNASENNQKESNRLDSIIIRRIRDHLPSSHL